MLFFSILGIGNYMRFFDNLRIFVEITRMTLIYSTPFLLLFYLVLSFFVFSFSVKTEVDEININSSVISFTMHDSEIDEHTSGGSHFKSINNAFWMVLPSMFNSFGYERDFDNESMTDSDSFILFFLILVITLVMLNLLIAEISETYA